MEKGKMKTIEVKTYPNFAMDMEVNNVPVLHLTRSEVEDLYFQLGAVMMDQDYANEFWESYANGEAVG